MLVIGGQARDIGKTSLGCAVLGELRDMDWTAIKISTYRPDESAGGDAPSLIEETGGGARADSARFLAAGARRSFWLRVPAGRFPDAMPLFREATRGAAAAIVESNRIMEFIDPNAYILLVDPARTEFKESARRFFDRASAYASWPPVLAVAGKPVFELNRDRLASPAMIQFIRERLREDR